MMKFKVGDRVYFRNRPDCERTVTAIRPSGAIDVKSDEGRTYSSMPASSYILITPINPTEEAVRLLTEAGYTVTPPPPKMTGMVHLYKHPATNFVNSLADSELLGRNPREAGTSGSKWIASVPWTEGDGL